MTNYTDEQIKQALVDAAALESIDLVLEKGAGYVNYFEVNDLRRILEHLPDQQDDWQECEFSEIRKGDRVKRVGRNKFGTIETMEGIVGDLTDGGAWDKSLRRLLAGKRVDHNLSLYRIPAPVVHPHPVVDPVILVHTFDGDQMPEGTYASITQNQAHAFVYELVPGDGTHPVRTRPDAIDEWEPAKVVPSNYPTQDITSKGVNP